MRTRSSITPRGTAPYQHMQQVFRAHEQLNNLLVGLIDDLNFDTVMDGEAAVKRTSKMVKDLVAVQITELRNALEVAAQTHLVTSLLSEAAVAKDAALLELLSEQCYGCAAHTKHFGEKFLGQQ